MCCEGYRRHSGAVLLLDCLSRVLVAAGGRDAPGLLPLLQCLSKFLVDPRYSRLLLGVAHRVLDAYGGEVRTTPCSQPITLCNVTSFASSCDLFI